MSAVGPATANAGTVSLWQRAYEALSRRVRDPNPILVKELRATFRRNLFIRFLYLSTGVVGVIVLSGGAAVAAGSLPPAEVGQIVFQIFFVTALMVICLVAPAYAATALTAEKEQRTYESLILSGMDPWRIVRGKFLAAYGSMFLVLVAQAPVVGIAFLFGGISPWHVLVGYAGLLLVLGPAVAFGIAVSARLESTRIAILLVTVVFAPLAFIATTMVAVLGEAAADAWSIGMKGPFWFTEALVSRFWEPDTFGLLVLLPLFVIGMTVWFMLASAVAGIRPAAEDRSSPFKVWSAVSALGLVVTVGLTPLLFASASEVAKAGTIFVALCVGPLVFYALVFTNEPPLPPRLADGRARDSLFARVLSVIGPGAAPTLRFAALLIVGTSFALAFVVAFGRHLYFPTYLDSFRYDAGLLVLAIGNSAVALSAVSFGAWLRVMLRNGIASRVLTIATLLTVAILPFLMALIIDPDSLEHLSSDLPFVVQLSPLAPAILGVAVADGTATSASALLVVVPTALYGLTAVLFWTLVEARVVAVRKLDAARRAEREERARTSRPSLPLLQRRSRPSHPVPPSNEASTQAEATPPAALAAGEDATAAAAAGSERPADPSPGEGAQGQGDQ